MDELDPRSKRNCILCLDFIDRQDYQKNGNFCPTCLAECAHLTNVNPIFCRKDDERREARTKLYNELTGKLQDRCTRNRKKRIKIFPHLLKKS